MFRIKFPTKRIFRIFPILRTDGMAPFCNLFIERPSYIKSMLGPCAVYFTLYAAVSKIIMKVFLLLCEKQM